MDFRLGRAVEDTKSNMFGSGSTKLGVESQKGEEQENKSNDLSFGKTATDPDRKKEVIWGSSTSKDDKPLLKAAFLVWENEDKEDAKKPIQQHRRPKRWLAYRAFPQNAQSEDNNQVWD